MVVMLEECDRHSCMFTQLFSRSKSVIPLVCIQCTECIHYQTWWCSLHNTSPPHILQHDSVNKACWYVKWVYTEFRIILVFFFFVCFFDMSAVFHVLNILLRLDYQLMHYFFVVSNNLSIYCHKIFMVWPQSVSVFVPNSFQK